MSGKRKERTNEQGIALSEWLEPSRAAESSHGYTEQSEPYGEPSIGSLRKNSKLADYGSAKELRTNGSTSSALG